MQSIVIPGPAGVWSRFEFAVWVVEGVVRLAVAVDHYVATPPTHHRDADPVAISGRQLPTGGQIVGARLAVNAGPGVACAINSRVLVAA